LKGEKFSFLSRISSNVMRSSLVTWIGKRQEGAGTALWCVLFAVGFCFALLAAQASCSQRRVEETVTVDAGRLSSPVANAQPVAVAPQLPDRDADIEQAGDHVAEAITRLKRRQSAAALTALAQAESALGRALRAESRDENELEAVRETLKGLETAERSIQRGALTEAATQLVALNRKVDAIGTRPRVNANLRP
jgi:glucan phosphoethanolaminetransferase (alkaline phosphatase superfamily)